MGTEGLVDKFEQKYDVYLKFVMQRQAKQLAQTEKDETQLRLPQGIPDRVHVVNMLEQQHCLVCDRPAPEGTPEYEAIRKLLPKENVKSVKKPATIPDIESELRIINRAGFSMREKYGRAEEEIAATYQEQEQLEDQRLELTEMVASLKGAIANELLNSGLTRDSSAGSILHSIEHAKRDIALYAGMRTRLQGERDGYLAELETVRNEFGNLTRGSGIDPKLEEKRKLLADLRDLTVRTKDTQYKRLIQQLEDTANQHFSSMNERTGAVFGKIRFVEEGSGYVPEIQDDAGARMENLNTSQVSSFKLAIIMAIVTANHKRGFARNYPLISDAPMSDFDPVKARAFLAEAARAFGQSVVIVKDFLDAHPHHAGQYLADAAKLAQVKEDVEKAGKSLNVYQLVIPPGQSNQNRKSLSVQINRLTV